MKRSTWMVTAVCLLLPGSTNSPAQTVPATVYPRASGPMGPSPVGRSDWRVPTLVELASFLNWKVAVPAAGFRGLTLAEAIVRTDTLALGYVEGSSTQWVSPEIRKNLDGDLTAGEVARVNDQLRRFHVRMAAYRVDSLATDDAARRKAFEFAKSLGAEVIVAPLEPGTITAADKLATEIGINVAFVASPAAKSPQAMLAVLQGAGTRLGILADQGQWMEDGVNPGQALTLLKSRLMAVSLHDRSAGPGQPAVPLGYGTAETKQFLQELYRLNLKPLLFVLNPGGDADATADLARSVDGFEQAVLPVLGDYMIRRSKTLGIRGADELAADVKQKIEEAIPHVAAVPPKKPRKLLVLDEHMGHAPIPHANFALELMGKTTGAYEAVFSNDLENLRYDKIRQFDAVMLNSSESDVSADPGVREGLLRFVREGGGLGGIHAASWSAAFWPEFMEMMGASQGPHRVQQATLKIDDPASPLTKMFEGNGFTDTDEYYRMTDTGLQGTYYSRDKVHVLLSVDMAKTPDFNEGRAPFVRQDNDYAVAWIKGYGAGRIFYCTMGHTPRMFLDPKLNQFLLAAMQFILGDLPADTTPSAEVGVK